LSDPTVERLGLSSLRAERMAAVLPEIRGRCLDIGANDNTLIRLYRAQAQQRGADPSAQLSVGVDVEQWGSSDVVLIESSVSLPFEDATFDTVTVVATLNFIPDRERVLRELRRVTRRGGRLIITMLSKAVGTLCHTVTQASIGHRPVKDAGQAFGLTESEIRELVERAGYRMASRKRFLYGLNSLYVAQAV
jgi:ubiquinone/menaquinone biosynthesis C-methylase UbiE